MRPSPPVSQPDCTSCTPPPRGFRGGASGATHDRRFGWAKLGLWISTFAEKVVDGDMFRKHDSSVKKLFGGMNKHVPCRTQQRSVTRPSWPLVTVKVTAEGTHRVRPARAGSAAFGRGRVTASVGRWNAATRTSAPPLAAANCRQPRPVNDPTYRNMNRISDSDGSHAVVIGLMVLELCSTYDITKGIINRVERKRILSHPTN